MDLLTAANDLKNLSDQQLQQELLRPSGQFPSFLALSEIQRRKDMRQDAQVRQQAGPQPSMAQQYAQGLGQANSPYANAVKQGEGAPTQPPQGMMTNSQMAAGPMNTPLGQQPGVQGFADGGPVQQWTPQAAPAPPGFLARLFDNGGSYTTQQAGTTPVLPAVGASKVQGVGPGVATSPLAQQAPAPQLASSAQQRGLGSLMQNPQALQGFADGGPVGDNPYTAMPGSLEGRMRALAQMPLQTTAPYAIEPTPYLRQFIPPGQPAFSPAVPAPGTIPQVTPIQRGPMGTAIENAMQDVRNSGANTQVYGGSFSPQPAPPPPPAPPAGLGSALGGFGALAPSLASPAKSGLSVGYGGGEPDVPPGAGPADATPPAQALKAPSPATTAGGSVSTGGTGASTAGGVSTGGTPANNASGRGQTLADYYKSIQDIKLPDRYGDLAAQNAKDREDLQKQSGQNAGLALAQAGFAMAAGNSPYALQNIGQGGMAGIKFWNDSQKEMQQAQRDLRNADQSIAIAQANRDERGLENAIKIKAHAEDLDSRAKDRASAAGIAASARAQALELKKMELDNDALNRSELREQHRIDGFQSTSKALGTQIDQLQTKMLGLKVDPLADDATKQQQQAQLAQTQALLQQRMAEQAQATDMWKRATLQREVRLGNVVVADPKIEGNYFDVKTGKSLPMRKGMRFMTNDYRTGVYGGGE